MNNQIELVLDQVFEPYLKHGGDDYIGEPVSQIEHMSQCAELARRQGHDDEVILAAFFHDLGHICAKYDEADDMGGYGRISHEKVGADFLRFRGFSEKIVALVERHVEAKRYLCARSSAYYNKLSQASKQTLTFQGGAMSAAEVAAFESDPLHSLCIKVRAWDELAKQQNQPVPDLDIYRSMARKHLQQQAVVSRLQGRNDRSPLLMSNYLSEHQLNLWQQDGCLKIGDYFTESQKQELLAWVADMQARPESAGKWMKYFEAPVGEPGGRQLCRVENFLQFHAGFDALLRGEKLIGILSELMGEPAVLFKEKINFKLPGGNGFLPHQDAPAFTSFDQTYHITMMVSIDPCNEENGCLEMVPGHHRQGILPTAADATIDPDLAETLNWEPLPSEIGDIVFFDSYLPHRSGPNRSEQPRRVLYITYNRASEGSYREKYYRCKRDVFPPDIERDPKKEYKDSGVFNVGNPIK